MTICTLFEAASIVKGTYSGSPSDRNLNITSVVVDSRKASRGSLFVALPGSRVDGASFIEDAYKHNAVGAMVRKDMVSSIRASISKVNVPLIVVDNPLLALQQLASAHVSKFNNIVKIGVTGSCGKTTTKEMLYEILSTVGNTAKTPGNQNSDIGLPLSLFGITGESRFGVFEMGVDHVGEMDTMLGIYRPDIGILTNIGYSHLGKMGSMRAIVHEKSKMFHESIEKGFVSEQNAFKPYIEKTRNIELDAFGRESTSGIHSITSQGMDGWLIAYKGLEIHLHAVGQHNLMNALGAIGVAQSLHIEPEAIKSGLEHFMPVGGRSRIIDGAITIIEDCYNASPDSTNSILDYMGSIPWNGSKRVVLGSMKELGQVSSKAHIELGRKILTLQPESVSLYGKETISTYDMLIQHGFDKPLFHTEDYDDLQQRVLTESRRGDLVLVKGSRSMAMEKLVPAIQSIA
ncbi:MAG: UDP-N-acetylmuramoyl-tripeptide--D-alanyl-D-alanine ligase [Sphaerochaetaceae bacterium]|jgi:UDP-N-acetylmuramoyl-tripeptide--D-alanyl-D-alanine ligase|nr:UDP-N-acetylmuramoyl-tripeptide--D-alanyl-D-alanine ligase [Sphaerochaetaceae bacterium]MDD3670224.1 UDP-N-acetylmuramoyl-tripeptide--D-alanyl-D-alanine ligase [Sphaerochaetaceae bacterium]MDD4259107.1 UDP-N-acetylmuramoyl-tripeptide--D-alanyl-D-alanine ligase [Sphaerochaetaceae bacterium]MDD5075663.1 UDP-N-acetylmuramoyl-tripeptide--D-alanyl-D-alanine ligase [Sphaerochaetaceae bacterium]